MFVVIVCLLYFICGGILSIPYCLLAGWDRGVFPAMTIATPLLLLVWIFTAFFAGVVDIRPTQIYWRNVFRRLRPDQSRTPLAIFWIWTVYMLLPIILHWSARLLGYFEIDALAAFLEKYRYQSLGYVFWGVVALCMTVMALNVAADALDRFRAARSAATPSDK